MRNKNKNGVTRVMTYYEISLILLDVDLNQDDGCCSTLNANIVEVKCRLSEKGSRTCSCLAEGGTTRVLSFLFSPPF